MTALHVLQAGIYGYILYQFGERFWWDALILGAAVAAQLGAIATLSRPSTYRQLNLATTALVLLMYARFVLQGVHVLRTFGWMAGDAAVGAMLTALTAAPWMLALPVFAASPWRGRSAVALVGLLPLLGAARPMSPWVEGLDEAATQALAHELSGAVWAGLSGDTAALPEVPEDMLVLVTPVSDGKPGATVCGTGGEVEALIGKVRRPAGRGAVVVELPWRRLPAGWIRPGFDAPLRDPCPPSPTFLSRKAPTRWVSWGWSSTGTEVDAASFVGSIASEDGVVDLLGGWTRGAPLSSESIRAVVRLGAEHLIRGMTPEGKFTYIVRGPDGNIDKGYNYPRHAGTAWFLARAAAALDDETIGAAADRALDHLVTLTRHTEDDAWYIDDPMRKDGVVWVGTNGLAVAAASLRPGHRDALIGWARNVASAVDEAGQVRNDASDEDGIYKPSDHSAYAQGQGLLALALTTRALGDDTPADVRAALDRARGYLDTADYLGSRHPLVTGDEHWMCITAHALQELFGADDAGTAAARRICVAYLTGYRSVPDPEAWRPNAGGAGGIAEAIIAHAYDTGDPWALKQGEGYADVLLASWILPTDAVLFKQPDRLIGGIRQTPAKVEIQIDMVQHGACALLEWMAVIEGKHEPGWMP